MACKLLFYMLFGLINTIARTPNTHTHTQKHTHTNTSLPASRARFLLPASCFSACSFACSAFWRLPCSSRNFSVRSHTSFSARFALFVRMYVCMYVHVVFPSCSFSVILRVLVFSTICPVYAYVCVYVCVCRHHVTFL
jgi:hypothetical protein